MPGVCHLSAPQDINCTFINIYLYKYVYTVYVYICMYIYICIYHVFIPFAFLVQVRYVFRTNGFQFICFFSGCGSCQSGMEESRSFFLGRCGDSMMPKNTFARGGPKIYRKLYEMWTFNDFPGLRTRFPERKPFVLHRNDDSIKESHAFAGEGRSCTAWTSNSTAGAAIRAWDSIDRRPN